MSGRTFLELALYGILMSRRLLLVPAILLCLTFHASAQAPSPEAIKVARDLVTTMKLPDRYKALLPAILFRIKPLVTQERPEIERDFDLMAATIVGAYTPYLNEMLEQAAMVYAANFTVDEMQQIDAFLQRPSGQKLLEKWPSIDQQTAQIGQDVSRKAAEDLKTRLTDALRQKGHKF
jgi:uncharacterized protein